MTRIAKAKTKIANIIYQLLWFGIYSKSNPFPDLASTATMEDFLHLSIGRFEKQIKLAESIANFFKVSILLLVGDSNSGVFNSFFACIRFNAVTISMGIPGTRSDQWLKCLQSKEAKNLLNMMEGLDCWVDDESVRAAKMARLNPRRIMVWNVSGNSVLQKSMKNAKVSLRGLREMFPLSFNILIPPIHTQILDSVPNDIDYEKDVESINSYIMEEWEFQSINLRAVLQNPITGDSWYGYLSDPVHYSKTGQRIITRALNWVLGLY